MKLIKGLPDKKLLARIDKYSRWNGIGERALGFYLLDYSRRGLHRMHGFAGIAQFALMRHQIPARKTRDLLRIARALEDLPLTDAAFARGRISWSAVRELTRVATRETEREWLDLAETGTLRQIERAVSRAAHGERPPRDPYGLSKTKIKVVAELPVEDYAMWQTAFDRLARKAGGGLDVSTAFTLMVRSFLESPPDAEEKAAGVGEAFHVVYHRCTECERAWLQTGDGPEGMPAEKVDAILPRAKVIRLPEERPGRAVGAECEGGKVGLVSAASRAEATANEEVAIQARPTNGAQKNGVFKTRNSCLTRINADEGDPRGSFGSGPETTVVPFEQRDKPNTPAIRQQVLSRDGRCCVVPGCGFKGQLYAHHVKWKSHGGKTVIDNEISVCGQCHGLIHEGLLRIEGQAPGGLEWYGPEGETLTGVVSLTEDAEAYMLLERKHTSNTADDPRGSSGVPSVGEIQSLDDVPDEIDTKWWKRHGHNFEIKGDRLVFVGGAF